MKTRVKKAFLDINEEEKWLNEQGAQGMMLLSYSNGTYEFEDMSPAAFQYKVDIPQYSEKERRRDYLDFLEQTGVSVVAEYADRVYLRKKASGEPFALYTDRQDVERQAKKRSSHLYAIGFPQIMLGVMFLMQAFLRHEGPVSFWVPAVFGSLFVVSGIVFLVLGLRAGRKATKGQVPSREERDIWEA